VNRVVVDASVAAKWLLPPANEPFTEKAIQMLERYVSREIQILVPDLFWVETGNLLWNAARTGRCTHDEAKNALEKVTAQKFPTVPSLVILDSAFEIARSCGRTVYDCLYVALAEAFEAELVTADEKLVNAVAARYPVISLRKLYNRS
jgi:predicted nucleic acid-binding protein